MRKLLTTLTLALLLTSAASAQVSDYSQLRTNSWSLYGLGGASAATGDRLFENVSPSPDTYVAPMVGAGVTYNVRPWLRFNLGYEGSKYRREQRFASVQANGLSYRSLEVLYNDAEFNLELNLAQMFRKKGTSGRFNIYLGSGIGEMFAYGVDYTVVTGSSEFVDPSPFNDNYTFQAWLKTDNDDIAHMSPYIPANLSIEYDITPRFTLGLRGSAKYILNKEALNLPTLTESVGLVARVNLVGQKRGYTSKAKRIVALESSLADAVADGKAVASERDALKSDLASANNQINTMKSAMQELEQRLSECGASSSQVKALMEEIRDLKAEQYIVYFENASAVLSKKAKATIAEAAARLESDPQALTVITASCNTLGGEEYNKTLSDRRAEAVRQALLEAGVGADRISDIVSLGKEGMTADASCRRAIIDVR